MDIVLTWPKKDSLSSYLQNLRAAHARDETILFSVSAFPTKLEHQDRVYMVHSGRVRGWTEFLDFVDGDVRPVDPRTGRLMEAGRYLRRSAFWHPLSEPLPLMKGFQGFRYADPDWRTLPEADGIGA